MSKALLAKFIKLAIEEAHSARVPQQLLQPSDKEEGQGSDEEQDVQEFSGVGAVAGFTAPLGSGPFGDAKASSKRKKK
jgi:hypothetical protein